MNKIETERLQKTILNNGEITLNQFCMIKVNPAFRAGFKFYIRQKFECNLFEPIYYRYSIWINQFIEYMHSPVINQLVADIEEWRNK